MDERELIELLEERGITNPAALIANLDFEVTLATVRYFDDKSGPKGPGLLVHLLRDGGTPGYKRPEERLALPQAKITPRLLQAIRGSCNSPDGITRDEARGIFAAKAKRMGLPVDALIDEAMGADWQQTPRHPALSPDGTPEERTARYTRWVNGEDVEPPVDAGEPKPEPVQPGDVGGMRRLNPAAALGLEEEPPF